MGRLARAARSIASKVLLIGATAFLAPSSVDYVHAWRYGLRHDGRISSQVAVFGGTGWHVAIEYGSGGDLRRGWLHVRLDNYRPWPDATFLVESSEPWLAPFVARFEGPTVNAAAVGLIIEAPQEIDEALAVRIATSLRATTLVNGEAAYEVRFEDPRVTPPERLAWYPDYVLDWWGRELDEFAGRSWSAWP